MTFRRDCRYLGGFVESGERICGHDMSLKMTCDGCDRFRSVHTPCDECGIVAKCASSRRPKAASLPVAVVITAHNYGRYLTECVESVRGQTMRPAEIIVIDDSSTDDTVDIAERLGVNYCRVDFRNVVLTRKAGIDATKSPFVVCLDADDKLGPTYLEECVKVMQEDESLGLVTSDMQMFGDRDGLLTHKPCNIEQRNWLHSGSLIRRTAIEASEAFKGGAVPGLKSHDDWFIWRRIIRSGWKAATTGKASYLYRQHGESMMSGSMRLGPYHIRAALHVEPVTLFLSLSGRLRHLDRLLGRISDWRPAEMIVVNSGDDEFKSTVRERLNAMSIDRLTLIDLPDSHGLADRDRRDGADSYIGVQKAMPLVYRHLRERLTTEYAFVVEDDVLPPANALESLLRSMDESVAAVSGVVPSRYVIGTSISWTSKHAAQPLGQSSGVEQIDGSGFGCLLLRRSAMLDAPPFNSGGTGNYDFEFARAIKNKGWRWLIEWSLQCVHGEIGLVEVDFVTPNLAVGNAINSAADAAKLKSLGITHVLNCREESDEPFIGSSGIVLLDNGTHDTKPPYDQPAEWFHRSIQFAQCLIHPQAKLFVHCAGGISRGPSTAYAILRSAGMTEKTAESMIRKARPKVGLEYMRAAESALK